MTEPRAGLQVPRSPVQVAIALDGGAPRQVRIFVAEHAGPGACRQAVADLLDGANAFLPIRDFPDGDWSLINRDLITWIGIPLSPEPMEMEIDGDDTSVDAELFDVRKPVALTLAGGGRLEGELLYSPRAGRGRVADFLNDAPRFFWLWATDAVYFIQRRAVVRLIEL